MWKVKSVKEQHLDLLFPKQNNKMLPPDLMGKSSGGLDNKERDISITVAYFLSR